MDQFRRLMQVVLLAGAVAGFALFLIQHFTIGPLIQTAETYEKAAQEAAHIHEDEGWQPSEGFERTGLTAISTTLTGIGFAALLFGGAAFSGMSLDWKRGVMFGIACFTCLTLAPAMGLPPLPPGSGVAELDARQLWWIGTAIATAAGLWLLVDRKRSWMLRVVGVGVLLVPHIIGAPKTNEPNLVPLSLIHQFSITSVASLGIFWIVLGSFGGFLYARSNISLD